MRFFLYVSVLLMILPLVFMRPFFGLCVYYVVSLLQPKFLCWRGDFQDAVLVGVPLVVGAIAIGVRRLQVTPKVDQATGKVRSVIERLARNPIFEPTWQIALFVLLILYIAITRLLVPYPLEHTSFQFRNLCKVLLVTALLTGLVCDARRFRILFCVIALSAAFWAIKGGLKVVLIGPHQVYGRTYDNNFFALVSVMALPLVFYFGLTVRHARWRTLFLVMSALICLGIIGSHSRAGFVAFGAVLVCMAWSSRYRLRAMFAICLMAGLAIATSWQDIADRMDSIIRYREDRSATARFYTWDVAEKLFMQSPLIGVGFNNFEIAKARIFGGTKAAHNIYLQNLSELGALGHPLWLAIILGTMLGLFGFMRRARRLPEDMRWAYYCSRGLLLALMAFCIHGTFHNEEYLELMFALVGLSIALRVVTRREIQHRRWYALAGVSKPGKKEWPRTESPRIRATPHPGELFDRPRSLGALLRRNRLGSVSPNSPMI
jgi:probable O-glycosylation ligase (exosortase A-associated)